MGSQSDWGVMSNCAQKLEDLGIPWEAQAISAHRATDALIKYLSTAEKRGVEVIIAAAGGAAHLPGVVAAKVTLPVLGVPMESASLKGMDSLLSIVQMPAGVPVGTLAIGAGRYQRRTAGCRHPWCEVGQVPEDLRQLPQGSDKESLGQAQAGVAGELI